VGQTWVKNLPRIGGEIRAKFGGDWSGAWHVKRGQRYKQSVIYIDSQPGPGAAREIFWEFLEFWLLWGPGVGLAGSCLC